MKRIEQAGGVVVNKAGQLLMVLAVSQMWTFPKGKIGAGEDPVAAARREIKEETGITELTLINELGSYERSGFTRENTETPSVIKHIRFYLFKTNQHELTVHDAGTLEAAWVDFADVAAKLSHEKDRAFFLSVQEAIAEQSPKR
jgi:8-oxo-dGTP pyrophosphatase MutT (NUDIX family)